MAVQLASVVTDLEQALDSPRPAEAAAKALEETARTMLGRSDVLGGDLRMSNFKGAPVKLRGEHKPSLAWIELAGGTFALIDEGREKRRSFIVPKRKGRIGKVRATKKRKGRKGRRPALMTPAGPRYRVKASRWTGKKVTARLAPKALDDATVAAQKVVDDIFARTV